MNKINKRCLYCKNIMLVKKLDTAKYCSRNCFYKSLIKERFKLQCKNCNKIILITEYDKKANKKFCSKKCFAKYYVKNKKGLWNKKSQIKAHNTNRINKTSFWNKKNNEIARAKSLELYPHGAWNSEESHNKSLETRKKLKIGFCHNPEIHKKAGLASIEAKRKRNHIEFMGIYFQSYLEREIAVNLFYQNIIKIIKRKTVHVLINGKEYDFYSAKYNCFIEPHQCSKFFDENETNESYYKARRVHLNENGYKDSNLVVLP